MDFADSRVCDHSGLEAIDTLADRYLNAGKTLHLIHLSDECRHLLKRAGSLVEVSVLEDNEDYSAHKMGVLNPFQPTDSPLQSQ